MTAREWDIKELAQLGQALFVGSDVEIRRSTVTTNKAPALVEEWSIKISGWVNEMEQGDPYGKTRFELVHEKKPLASAAEVSAQLIEWWRVAGRNKR
jgi:hypothetical protein